MIHREEEHSENSDNGICAHVFHAVILNDTLGGRVRLGDRGMEQKGKRTHGHGQQCSDCCGEGGIRGLTGNGKNTKIKSK